MNIPTERLYFCNLFTIYHSLLTIYWFCLDPCEVTGGGTVIFEVRKQNKEG